ncbi:hypothetical protein ABEG18_17845 [Alsobacter sp. KACC 23698]|uniref:Uncharacterized protein n=1 Tax=Alsobacter sp. KACC 23698 TaxID=3149229 RepID=A0AAU7JB46_9HYPH
MKTDLKDPRPYPPDAAQPGEAMVLIRQQREAILARTERLRRERLSLALQDIAHAHRTGGLSGKAS